VAERVDVLNLSGKWLWLAPGSPISIEMDECPQKGDASADANQGVDGEFERLLHERKPFPNYK
jgi:hypothetical protein